MEYLQSDDGSGFAELLGPYLAQMEQSLAELKGIFSTQELSAIMASHIQERLLEGMTVPATELANQLQQFEDRAGAIRFYGATPDTLLPKIQQLTNVQVHFLRIILDRAMHGPAGSIEVLSRQFS